MKTVSRGQALEISSRFQTQVNWDKLDGNRLQEEVVNLTPEEFGERFTAFLENGARMVVNGQAQNLTIDRSKLFDPAEFVGEGWTIWRGPENGNGLDGQEDWDVRLLALTKLDLSKVHLEHMLTNDELKSKKPYIDGEEKHRRLKNIGHIRLDPKVLQTLLENEKLIPESWKKKTNGYTTYVFFDGIVLRGPGGLRSVLSLCWLAGGWRWHCRCLGYGFRARHPSAVLASIKNKSSES